MKKLFTLFALVVATLTFAQTPPPAKFVDGIKTKGIMPISTGVGVGTLTPQGALDVVSTTKGMLIPRVTTTQKNAIASPITSMLVYDSTLGVFNYWSGSAWVVLGGGATSDLQDVVNAGAIVNGVPIILGNDDGTDYLTFNAFDSPVGGIANGFGEVFYRTGSTTYHDGAIEINSGAGTLLLPSTGGTLAKTSNIPTNTSQLTNGGVDGTNPFIIASDIPAPIPSQLERITDGNTGWRLLGQSTANRGYIGVNAIDLTLTNITGSTTNGATGYGSFAVGIDATASGINSFVEGVGTTASGDSSHAQGDASTASGGASHAEGRNTLASGLGSHSEGSQTTASGVNSHVNGTYNKAQTYSETVVGLNATEITGNATAYDVNDPAYRVGIGSTNLLKRDGIVVWKSGAVTAPQLTDSLIVAKGAKSLVTKEHLDAAIAGGAPDLSGYVPYTGANTTVDLANQNLKAGKVTANAESGADRGCYISGNVAGHENGLYSGNGDEQIATHLAENNEYIYANGQLVFNATDNTLKKGGLNISTETYVDAAFAGIDFSPYLTDAPSDANYYGRSGGVWQNLAGIFQTPLGYTAENTANKDNGTLTTSTTTYPTSNAVKSVTDALASSAALKADTTYVNSSLAGKANLVGNNTFTGINTFSGISTPNTMTAGGLTLTTNSFTITGGSTTRYVSGTGSTPLFDPAVLAAVITAPTLTNSPIATGNTVLVSLGKLQAQTTLAGSYTSTATAVSTFTVTIGTTQANTTYKVTASPSNALSAASYYITNKTTTTFDVMYLTALTGAIAFDWILRP